MGIVRKAQRVDPTVEFVQFNGSNSQAAAIVEWVESKGEDAYVRYDAQNQRHIYVITDSSSFVIYPNWWLVYDNGDFQIYREEQFLELFVILVDLG